MKGLKMPREDRRVIWINVSISLAFLAIALIGGLLAWDRTVTTLKAETVPRQEIDRRFEKVGEKVGLKLDDAIFQDYRGKNEERTAELLVGVSELRGQMGMMQSTLARIDRRLAQLNDP